MLTRGNEADGALQPGAAKKEFLEALLYKPDLTLRSDALFSSPV
jgi:hypothetical protein